VYTVCTEKRRKRREPTDIQAERDVEEIESYSLIILENISKIDIFILLHLYFFITQINIIQKDISLLKSDFCYINLLLSIR